MVYFSTDRHDLGLHFLKYGLMMLALMCKPSRVLTYCQIVRETHRNALQLVKRKLLKVAHSISICSAARVFRTPYIKDIVEDLKSKTWLTLQRA